MSCAAARHPSCAASGYAQCVSFTNVCLSCSLPLCPSLSVGLDGRRYPDIFLIWNLFGESHSPRQL